MQERRERASDTSACVVKGGWLGGGREEEVPPSSNPRSHISSLPPFVHVCVWPTHARFARRYSLTTSNMYKQETTVNTDAYLANSKLMDGDDDEPDENASGIAKARPLLYKDLVKHMSAPHWWNDLLILKHSDMALCTLRKFHTQSVSAAIVYEGKKYGGVTDCMEMCSALAARWRQSEIQVRRRCRGVCSMKTSPNTPPSCSPRA